MNLFCAASQFGVHPIQISRWRQQLLDRAAELFEDGRRRPAVDETSTEELYAQIGRLQMEVAWLKKGCRARLRRGGRGSPRHGRDGRIS